MQPRNPLSILPNNLFLMRCHAVNAIAPRHVFCYTRDLPYGHNYLMHIKFYDFLTQIGMRHVKKLISGIMANS